MADALLFSAVDAAREIGVTERTIRRAIAAGRLPARKVSGTYEISLADAELACKGPHAAALREALETLREVGFERDADEIERHYGV